MNVKRELLKKLAECKNSFANVKFARIETCTIKLILKEDYTHDELAFFLDNLDFEYNEDYGSQELQGFVVFKDNSWLERYNYDGKEEWVFKKCPDFNKIIAKE
jgi:hypothetical protein